MTRKLAATLAVLVSLAVPAGATAGKNSPPWPVWGNDEIADCTFAAAANWELGALGHGASEAQIRREYFEAGGAAEGGLSQDGFAHWWSHHGIGGIRAQIHEVSGENVLLIGPSLLPTSAVTRIERLLQRAHYLLADMNWGNHEILLTGYTSSGLNYVSYGEESFMPWAEWREDSWGLFTLSVISD